LIELFGALTITEIEDLVKVLRVKLNREELRVILNQLERFDRRIQK